MNAKSMKIIKVLAYGELLFDIFPNESKIGGATFNFCGHFAKMGGVPYIVSGIGNDELGEDVKRNAEKLGIKYDYLFETSKYETGKVFVTLNNGSPTYNVLSDMAYDNIELSDEEISSIEKQNFDAVYFGTLVQRNSVSRATLHKLIKKVKFREVFCDINLRTNCYDDDSIDFCLNNATILKINRDEAVMIGEKLGGSLDDKKALCRKICSSYKNIHLIMLTLDKDGSYVYDGLKDKEYSKGNPKDTVVVSTVGAGDSFGACFMYYYLAGADIPTCMSKATIISNFVVSNLGALPDYDPDSLFG